MVRQNATLQQCADRKRAMSTTLTENSWRPHLRRRLDPNLTFGGLIDAYLGEAERVGKPLRDYRTSIEKSIRPALGELKAVEVTPSVLAAWIVAMRTANYWDATINNRLSIIASICRFGCTAGVLASDPCRDIPNRPGRKVRNHARAGDEVLELEQIATLLAAELPPELAIVFAVLLLTGMRLGEASALTWGRLRFVAEGGMHELTVDASWDCKTGVVRGTKTRRARSVPVHPRLLELLTEWRSTQRKLLGRPVADTDLICPRFPLKRSEGCVHWAQTTILRYWHRELARVGIAHPVAGPRRLHATRHTFVTQLVRAGASERVVQKITHDEPVEADEFNRYNHVSFAQKCEAILKLQV